jgi:hypothetical protein
VQPDDLLRAAAHGCAQPRPACSQVMQLARADAVVDLRAALGSPTRPPRDRVRTQIAAVWLNGAWLLCARAPCQGSACAPIPSVRARSSGSHTLRRCARTPPRWFVAGRTRRALARDTRSAPIPDAGTGSAERRRHDAGTNEAGDSMPPPRQPRQEPLP